MKSQRRLDDMGTIVSTESIEEYRSFLSDQGWSVNTIRAYVTDVRLWFSGRTTIPLIDLETEAKRWLNANRRNWEPRTFMRKVTSLRSFMKWMGLTNPLANFKLPTAAPPEPHPLPR